VFYREAAHMAVHGKTSSGTTQKLLAKKRAALKRAAKRGILRALGLELKRRREMAGLTQMDLGAEAGVSGNYVGGIERGIFNPSVIVLSAIAGRLKVNLSALFSGAESLGL
jgi:DNA-binding XRE family transcriptional regulator